MSRKKLRIQSTDKDNLISNLRGEVGEIVSTWVLMRGLTTQIAEWSTGDTLKDSQDTKLATLYSLRDKLNDEIIARIAELADQKVGRLTFYFACLKLNDLENETAKFAHFIEEHRFREKRNYDISHKELPEKSTGHKFICISYPTILRGIASALLLMKKIDAIHLGPRSKYLWREMRRRRYTTIPSPKSGYMLLPYLRLSAEDRMRIIKEELYIGCNKWIDMHVKINGKETTIKTYGELGALILGREMLLLDESFIDLTSINVLPSEADK